MRCWKKSGTVLLWSGMVVALQAQTYTVLVNFDISNGQGPGASLVQGLDGNFYGTTLFGGKPNCHPTCGTVFKMTPEGTLTTLHRFSGADGETPGGTLVQGTDGNLYGTTQQGGRFCGDPGCGTVFKITPEGMLTTLHSFNMTDGWSIVVGLVQGADANLYGTTPLGGPNNGAGTVFKITPAGVFTTLHTFAGGAADGNSPNGLVEGIDGNFYSTTDLGGFKNCGTVFKITPTGVITMLHSFSETDGCFLNAGLMQAANGSFYGTTYDDGMKPAGGGTVFKMTPSGALTTVHNFDRLDGAYPIDVLIQGSDGNRYGTTTVGGEHRKGTIFQIRPGAKLTTLHSFDGTDGDYPICGLVQGTNGDFYGATIIGGTNHHGIVFRLSLGLGPFVKTLTASGKVGATVIILGTDLTGSTGVTFNGTPAAFTVVSATEITATVPEGATTGMVEVTTPGGTLSSNVAFQVTH